MVHAFNPTIYVNTNGGRSRRISEFKSSLVDRRSSRITEYTQRKKFYFKKGEGEERKRGEEEEEEEKKEQGHGMDLNSIISPMSLVNFSELQFPHL